VSGACDGDDNVQVSYHGPSSAATSLAPALCLSLDLQDLGEFWELPNIFLFFTGQPGSDSVVYA
jgi:hypothetical protein